MVNLNKDILLGTAIGDALGVPVEFEHRQELGKNPVVEIGRASCRERV